MYRIVPEIDRPKQGVVAGFEEVPSPVASDIMQRNRQTMDSGIKPVADSMTVAGPALTVDATAGDNLVLHKALTLAQPGDVLVVDANGYSEAGIWGELMSVTAANFGLAGTLIDGAVRDIRDIEALGYPVFSRHISPKGSTKQLPGSINVPVSCGGIPIEPGDIVVGDADGVAVVPRTDAEAVLDSCTEKLRAEAASREQANTPANYSDVFERILDQYVV